MTFRKKLNFSFNNSPDFHDHSKTLHYFQDNGKIKQVYCNYLYSGHEVEGCR